ncbi:hypothetical protein N9L19_01465, partial [bacterium]|nr:hypothetical protein [bacterium]
MTSKTSEIAAAGKAIETKTPRSGQASAEPVQDKVDLDSIEKADAEDSDSKANIANHYSIKPKEWDERCKPCAQEIEAISYTIKLLNSDNA